MIMLSQICFSILIILWSFPAKWLHQNSQVTQSHIAVLVSERKCKAPAPKWRSCSAFNPGELVHSFLSLVHATDSAAPQTLGSTNCYDKPRGFIIPSLLKTISHGERNFLNPSQCIRQNYGLVKHTESFGTNTGTILTPALLEYSYFQIKSELWNVNITGQS